MNRAYQYLDLVPKGRGEEGLNSRWSGYVGMIARMFALTKKDREGVQ